MKRNRYKRPARQSESKAKVVLDLIYNDLYNKTRPDSMVIAELCDTIAHLDTRIRHLEQRIDEMDEAAAERSREGT